MTLQVLYPAAGLYGVSGPAGRESVFAVSVNGRRHENKGIIHRIIFPIYQDGGPDLASDR